MTVDEQAFKAVMARWTTGITVVTAADGHQHQGVTVNAFASVSLQPALVMVSIDHKLVLHDLIEKRQTFAVNLLSDEQLDWGMLFAGMTGDIDNRFAGIEVQTAITGSPLLPNTLGWLDCEVRHTYSVSDHTLFIGEVMAADTPHTAPPLAYHNRRWGSFIPLPADE